MRREDKRVCPTGSALLDRRGCRYGVFDWLLGTTNARRFALELAQIIELRAANAACLQNFNRADHWRIDGEDSFDANSKADAPNRERCPGKMAAPADYNAFKRLDALFFALGFLQPNVHPNGITGAERGNILASLVLADLLNYATHMDSPGQTR
jgi:hypothetical protein